MSNVIATTKEKPLVIHTRVKEDGVTKTLTFLNADGSPHPITSYNFEYLLKAKPGTEANIFRLSIGDGLTISGADDNELLFDIDEERASIRPLLYFGLLRSVSEDKTWLNVKHKFFDGHFDGEVDNEETINIYQEGNTITLTISGSGGGAGIWGSITGALSNQTDLQTALDLKADEADLGSAAFADTADFDPAGAAAARQAQLVNGNGTTIPLSADRVNLGGALSANVSFTTAGAYSWGIGTGSASLFFTTGGNLQHNSFGGAFNINGATGVISADVFAGSGQRLIVTDAGGVLSTLSLQPAVLATPLTGLSISGSTINSTDSILQAFGKLQNQITAVLGGVTYQGVWNATTNSPSLSSGVGTNGYYYVVSVAGSTNLDGITDWKVGDWAVFSGTTWQKVDNTDAVVSVNGYVGIVTLTTSDIAQGTNLYFTNAAAIGATLTGYTSGAGTISSADTILGAIQKLNGNDATKWSLASGGTLTGANTITSNAQDQLIYNGTWTATTGTSYNHISMTGSLTARATASDTLRYLSITPTLVAGAATQVLTGLFLNVTFTPGAFSPTMYIARLQNAGTDRLTITDTGGFTFQTSISGTYATFRDSSNITFRVNNTGSVFLGTGSNARIGSATNVTSTFLVSGGSVAYQSDMSHYFLTSTTFAMSANGTLYSFAAAGFSGGSSTFTGTFMSFTPTINVTAGNNIIEALKYNPTLTSVAGVATHYGLLIAPTACLNGFGTLTPTAVVDVAAATTARASIRIRSGVAPTSPNDGDLWSIGTDLQIRLGGVTYTLTKV